MIVIDASLALEVALATTDGEDASERLRDKGLALAAPEIIELEVLQALRRLARLDRIDASAADNALNILSAMEIERFSHRPLRTRIWEMRDNLTAYDAAYFALAELLDAPLWTRDRKFRDVPRHAARIEIV
ncbi:MAG: type II toxin-antitoxin system VapC family toxin [Pseudomonadota bacterium]